VQVRRILHGPRLQPKLTVGPPGDAYEREADRVADAVMRMPEPEGRVQRACAECEEEMQRQPATEKEEEDEDKTLQAKETPGQIPEVTPDLESRIAALRGGGEPLPSSERAFFEPRFGQEFGDVRIHSGPEAADLAQRVQARAFTLGDSIVFGAGQYAPGDGAGRQLLAHELTHVVQQGREQARRVIQRDECDGTRRSISGTASVPGSIPSAGEIGEAVSRGFTGSSGATVTITASATFTGGGTSGNFSVMLRQCGFIWDSDVGARKRGSIDGPAVTFTRTLPDTGNYYLLFRNASESSISVDYSVS